MKITDALLGEHAVIYNLFDYVRDTVANSQDLQEIRGAVAALENVILAHAQVEEDLLFPRLEPHLGQMGPLAVMRAEHQEIDDLLTAARQEADIDTLKTLTVKLLDFAHSHFQKEEMVLFVMAQQVLDGAELTGLGDEWASRRTVTLAA